MLVVSQWTPREPQLRCIPLSFYKKLTVIFVIRFGTAHHQPILVSGSRKSWKLGGSAALIRMSVGNDAMSDLVGNGMH